MIEHRCKGRKPFKIGQLVRCKTSYKQTFCIVLELQWDGVARGWAALLLWQSTGQKLWYPTEYFVPTGESDG